MEASYVLAVVLTGLTVVFVGLILLIFFVWLMGKVFEAIGNPNKKKEEPKNETKAPANPPISAAAPAMEIEDGISDEIVAVISAAVASMSGGFVVKSVKKASSKASRRGAWGAQGIAENTRVF